MTLRAFCLCRSAVHMWMHLDMGEGGGVRVMEEKDTDQS